MNDKMCEFNIKMQDIIENHIIFVKAKAKWINDLVIYIKKNMENIDDQKIGEIKIYDGKIFFIVSQHIHKLLFLSTPELYDQYQSRFAEIGNVSKPYAKKKVQEFLRNLAEVLCVASLSEEVINDIYTSNFFKDSSLSINFETLDIKEVYQRFGVGVRVRVRVIYDLGCPLGSMSFCHGSAEMDILMK
jgi:hypothetical protein